ncbi:MAG: cytochrome C [Flavobacteriales bacterium]|nr:MAG: cytochrome C [Flavobacteriales bacterium]PIE49265.1 MAG: cytochrome C [Flavobacteriales bacterium]
MRLLSFIFSLVVLWACVSEKKSNKESESSVPERAELSKDSKIFLGNRLFSEKTCVTCHAVSKYKKAPSVKKIMRVYKENNGNIVAFLKGETKPMVDTTASQIAIMQDNINGFVKGLSDTELDAISYYMMHVDESNLDY